jgi:hypothetical protein
VESDLFEKDPIFSVQKRRPRFISRAEQDHLCYGFLGKDGEVAAYLWISIAMVEPLAIPSSLTGLRPVIRPGCAYIWDSRTARAYQAQGLHQLGLVNAVRLCSTKGINKVYLQVEPDNLPSIYGTLAAGFKEVSRYTAVRVGSFWIIRKPGRIEFSRAGHEFDLTGDRQDR